MILKNEKCLTAQCRVALAVHLGERSAGELFLDWSQAEKDGEVSLGSSEEKKAERAGLEVEAGSGGAGLEGEELSFTEPCQDYILYMFDNQASSLVLSYYCIVLLLLCYYCIVLLGLTIVLCYLFTIIVSSHLLIPGIFGEENFVQQAGPLLRTLLVTAG